MQLRALHCHCLWIVSLSFSPQSSQTSLSTKPISCNFSPVHPAIEPLRLMMLISAWVLVRRAAWRPLESTSSSCPYPLLWILASLFLDFLAMWVMASLRCCHGVTVMSISSSSLSWMMSWSLRVAPWVSRSAIRKPTGPIFSKSSLCWTNHF